MTTKTKKPRSRKKPQPPAPESPEPVEPKPLSAEQWSQLCTAAAAWHMITQAKLSELYDSVTQTALALHDQNSPLREFIDHASLERFRGYLMQADNGFPQFGTSTPQTMNIPDLMGLLNSFE